MDSVQYLFLQMFIVPSFNHQSLSYFQQVPSRNLSSNADVFLQDFLSEIPIFKLLGTLTLVESTAPYSDVSDPDVQLVCKYLRAYRIGGEKGIDRLYKEGMHNNPIIEWWQVHK